MKFNPDNEMLLYELNKKKRQEQIEDGIYQKVKEGMMESMLKFSTNTLENKFKKNFFANVLKF